MKTHRFVSAAALVAAVVLGVSAAWGGPVVWNGSTSTDWGTADNWDGGLPGNTDIAAFTYPTLTYQPSVGSAVTIDGIQVDSASAPVTVSAGVGGSLSVGASGITVDGGGTGALTLDVPIVGTGDLIKTGTGTMTLSGANTYSGSTTINAGTISASNIVVSGGASNLGNATTPVVLGGTSTRGTLNYTGGDAEFTRGFTINAGGGQLVNAGTGTLTVKGSTTSSANGNFTVGGTGNTAISGAINLGTGTLTKTGAGTATLSGSGTMGGATISGGTMNAGGTALGNGTVAIDSGALLKVSSTGPAYPTTNLVGRWTFDDGTAADSSENSYNGTPMNNPLFTNTDVGVAGGKCIVLNGTNQYVKVDTGGTQTVFDGGNAMTVSVWFKGWNGGLKALVAKDGESNGWQIRQWFDSKLRWTTRGINHGDMAGTLTTVSDGKWHMLTMTFDGHTKTGYVDGQVDNSMTINFPIYAAANRLLTFGAKDTGSIGSYFNGRLDDIYFYNRALTSTEVQQLLTARACLEMASPWVV